MGTENYEESGEVDLGSCYLNPREVHLGKPSMVASCACTKKLLKFWSYQTQSYGSSTSCHYENMCSSFSYGGLEQIQDVQCITPR
jgi:hypothetical protein